MKTSIAFAATALFVLSFVPGAGAAAEPGKAAPAFSLTDSNGKTHALADFKGKYVVLEWVNHGCPFVVKHYSGGNMQALQKEYTGKGVVWLSICSSAEGKQGFMTPADWNKALAEKKAASTAVLLDPEGTVGKSYGAKVTPHMFVIDPDGKVIYAGGIDNIRSTDTADVAKAENYVKAALDAAMAGKPVATATSAPYGCSVKFKE